MIENRYKILFLILFTISAVTSAIINDQSKKCPEELTCYSEGCKRASQQILENIDLTANPCDNFYQFACGGFIKSQKIPQDRTQISSITKIHNFVIDQLRTILSEPISSNEPDTFKLAKKFYRVCSNTSAIEDNNLNSVKRVIKDLGGWPAVEGDSWIEDEFDWKKLMYKFRKYGFSVKKFLGIEVEISTENPTQRIVTFDQADLPINRLNLLFGIANSITRSYYNYLVDVAVIFGANRDVALEQMKESFEFLVKLARITLPPEDRRNFTVLTNIMTIAELQQRFPHMNWIEFINNVIAIPGIQVNETDVVDVGIPKFINNLEVLLNQTSKRAQANYLIATTIGSMGYALNQAVRDREFQLMKEITGTEKALARWEECLNQATFKIRVAISALYARSFFKSDSKSSVETLVSNLRLRLLKMLNEVDWMDKETKKEALRKATGVLESVGYPSELMDDKKIDEYYSPLQVSNDYFEFSINVDRFESDRKFRLLREVVQRGNWIDYSTAHTVNAFYSLAENSIILPAGILQGVMFDFDRPQAMNYGAIGFIIAHELTHGFDDMGKQVSANGQLQNWWSETTAIEYINKAQCIINQYSNYSAIGIKLNGVITQGENIADNGGSKLAYDSYLSWLKHNGEDKCLPNLNFSPKQLFWISLANAWCTSLRLEEFRSEMLAQSHPPAYFRVQGILSNSKHFANDFQCSLDSPMNPAHKCRFW